jgi:hypothetical protein
MMMTNLHLSDDRLMEVCLDRAPDAREQQHLESCPDCETRRAGIALLLSDVTVVAAAEADAAFSEDRLARQQARILHRLEHEGRPGRVIAFPAGQGHEPAALRTRPGMRWVAAAAVAGLVIGLAAGHLAHDFSLTRPAPTQASLPSSEVQTLRAVSTGLSEEEFLGQLELAIEGSGGAALRPLDDLTPRVWEVAAR